MAQEQTVIRQKILQYYRSIKDIFPVKKVLLYGSYAKGQATKDSDIDIAVVVDMENQNQRCDITAQLMYHTVPIDTSIEPRCIFWEEYLHPEPASILDEIIRTGIEIVLMNPQKKDYFVHETACVDQPCQIGAGTKIWHFSHVCQGAVIGAGCNFGQNVFIAGGATIGDNVKIQNNVSVYDGITLEEDVFLGPSCVLTNVLNPRSQVIRRGLYEKTLIRRGATVGANATIVCGRTIGRYAFIAAGAVVTGDVPDYAFMVGVPARQKGWMSRHGHRLQKPDPSGIFVCPESGYRYQEIKSGLLRCLDLDEQSVLPEDKSVGQKRYREFKDD